MSALAITMLLAARALTLEQAVALAEQRSAELRAALVDEDRAQLRTLRANLERVQANVDASIGELYDKPNLFGPTPPGSPDILLGLSSLEARLAVPIFSGFRVEADIARAELLERASAQDTERERLALALAVARAYWGVRRLSLLEEAQRASTERLAESERLVKARVDAGLAPGLDINRAAARRVRLEVERTALVNQRREAAVRLAVVLGVSDEELELVDNPPAVAPDDQALDADAALLVAQALDARPELRSAELRATALLEEKRSVDSGYWPQLDAGLLMQLGNSPALAGAGPRAVNTSAIPFVNIVGDVQLGLTLRMNLFDTLQTTHASTDVAHRLRRASFERAGLAREVESEVRLAHARLASLAAQRASLVKAREIVGDNLVILDKAYGRGEVLFTEVLDVQVELADAERQIVDVDAQLVLARLELDAAAGKAVVGPPVRDEAAQAAASENAGVQP